jgi:hypothetical protein
VIHSGGCDCEVCTEPRIERIRASQFNADGYWAIGLKRPWEALCIGPRSMIDRCYVVPISSVESAQAAGAATAYDLFDYFGPHVIEVSVERPHFGRLSGPVAVFGPWAESTRLGTPARRGQFSLAGSASMGVIGDAQKRVIEPTLDLMLYPRCPTSLPSKRAPFNFYTQFTNFGNGGEDIVSIHVPGWGRRQMSFSFNFDLGTGDVFYEIDGVNVVNFGPLGSDSVREELLAGTTTPAGTQSAATYVFDGEFDYYDISLQEDAALDAGSEVSVWIKGWD